MEKKGYRWRRGQSPRRHRYPSTLGNGAFQHSPSRGLTTRPLPCTMSTPNRCSVTGWGPSAPGTTRAPEGLVEGVSMTEREDKPRALFPSPEGTLYPDSLVCSGQVPGYGSGQSCPHSEAGRMPLPCPLDAPTVRLSPELGEAGDLCPPCAVQHFGSLEAWLGGDLGHLPPGLGPLRLFRCRRWFLLVVPGLRDNRPHPPRSASPGEEEARHEGD